MTRAWRARETAIAFPVQSCSKQSAASLTCRWKRVGRARGGGSALRRQGRGLRFAQVGEPDERRMLQQHDRLAVPDRAARGDAVVRIVFGNEEMQLLGDRSGTHVGLENLAWESH